MNITLKQVRPDLHRKLAKQARKHGRSLNMEALQILEQGIQPDLEQIFSNIKKINARQKRPISGEEIVAMIREDRDSH